MGAMLSIVVTGVEEAIEAAKTFEAEVTDAYDAGLRNCATALRNATRAQLHRPGTGRQYPSRVGRTVRKQVAAIARLKAESAGGDIPELARRKGNLRRSKARLRQTLTRLNRSTPGGLHRASAPGEPPAPDVGLLPQAVKAGTLPDGTRIVGVGGSWEGWEALHEGKGRIHGKRPFFQLAIDRVKDKLSGILVSTIRERGVFDG